VKEMLAVVKCLSFSPSIGRRLIATEIVRLQNLRHSLIARLLEFLLPVESRGWCELKPVRLHATEDSLADVLSNSPAWWTPPVKAVPGISFALRFPRRLGLQSPVSAAVREFVSRMTEDCKRSED
jgi:hypothetical protein